MSPDASASWPRPHPYDFAATTRALPLGLHDPTIRVAADAVWRAVRTAEGPATVRLTAGDVVHAQSWGPGAHAVMADVPRWVGLHEPRWSLPSHPAVDSLLQRYSGLRGTDTVDVFEALQFVVLQQLVTWQHAAMTWARLCRALGEQAPGASGLWVSPTPRAVRSAPLWRLESLGIGARQARTLLEIARVANRLARIVEMPTADAESLLQKVPGIGPWTAAMVLGDRLGRPEPVPVGDVHIPHTIAWALAGERRGTDARMLELLEPFRGHAFRVVRLVWTARIEAPRSGPRRPLRWSA